MNLMSGAIIIQFVLKCFNPIAVNCTAFVDISIFQVTQLANFTLKNRT